MDLRRRSQTLLPLAVGLLLAAAPALAQAPDCTTLGQTTYVHDVLHDIYYWYGELPDTSPALFDSPEAYLEAVRYRPLDSSFSYIAERSANDALFSSSQYIGFGFSTKLVAERDLRIAQVFPDSPASEAALSRGDRILEINGRTVEDLIASAELGTIFGPAEVGVRGELLVRSPSGEERRVRMVKRIVTIPTVSLTRVFDLDGRRVGYVHFRNFVQPSFTALDGAVAELMAAGATELVLDLRYNGGGLISVAQHLASLMGGARTTGQVFAEFFHNDKNAFRNTTLRFQDKANALGLERIVVITTRASASASELVINSLRPFVRVVVVGETTFGKPVGQYGYPFCEKVFYPVAFTVRNALGQGDFFAGLPPDCASADELTRPLGDPAEASLAEALYFLRTGGCSAVSASQRALAERRPRLAESGWQQLLGAR